MPVMRSLESKALVSVQTDGHPSYATITETPGIGATQEQLSMLYTRYRFAASFCKGKDVLEVACGAGQGVGYLARVASRVVGGDIDESNLRFAVERYRERANIEFRRIDAHELPFGGKCFDVIILYEAIYYLERPEAFLDECRRVLREGGLLIICTVNKAWSDFNPSPFSTKYFSSCELMTLLKQHRFNAQLHGAFPVERKSGKDRIVSIVKRAAVALHLVPKTMKGKEILKRIFLGKLFPLPSEVEDGMADYIAPVPISADAPNDHYKVLYAVALVE